MRALTNIGFVLAGLALALQTWLAVQLAPMRAMYAEFSARLPLATEIAISPAWRYGAAFGILALLVLAIAKRNSKPTLAVIAGTVGVVCVAATYVVAQWPIFELAGAVK